MVEKNTWINKHTYALVSFSFLINLLFLWINYGNNQYCSGTLLSHGEVAYNVYLNNSVKVNSERMNLIDSLQEKEGRLIDYSEIRSLDFPTATHYRSIHDTIGYGVVIGLLWKLTHSLRYLDVQLLQIIIFSLLMILVYQIGILLFCNSTYAFLGGIAHLLFFPLIFQNIQVHRDIWAYYAVVIAIYFTLSFLYEKKSSWVFMVGCMLFSLIQYVRPNVYVFALVGLLLLFVCSWFDSAMLKKIGLMAISFFVFNGVFFWLPFMAYNKIAYNQWHVSCAGISLLASLGEHPNPWNFENNDRWYVEYMLKNYGLRSGTAECDEKAQELFWKSVKEKPLFYFNIVFRRLCSLFLPNLPWSFYPQLLYEGCASLKDKFIKALHSPRIFIDLVGRLVYVRLFLLLGYVGIVTALFRRRWELIMVWLTLMGAVGAVALIHPIEYRYLVPFYGIFPFFVTYGLCVLFLNKDATWK